MEVEPVGSEDEGPAPGRPPPVRLAAVHLPTRRLATLVGDEVRPDEGVVLAAQGLAPGTGPGARPRPRGRGGGTAAVRPATRRAGTTPMPGPRQQKPQQRLENTGERVTHIVNFPGFSRHGAICLAFCSDPFTE